MAIITSVKDYIKRHRKGIFISAAIAGGSYFAGKYAAAKIRDVQEKSTAERLAKENLKRRFQQNQNDCVFTVISLLPTLSDQILNELNIEAEWAKLQKSRDLEKVEKKLRQEREVANLMKEEKEATKTTQENDAPYLIKEENDEKERASEKDEEEEKSSDLDTSIGSLSTSVLSDGSYRTLPSDILDKKQKQMIWEDIKTKSFVRTLTSIYSITLLTLLSHIQLNLLGRFTYMWSVSVLNRNEPTIQLQQEGEKADTGYIDPQIEHMFLSTSWWLLHRGWKKCAKQVQEAADEIVSSIPLKNSLDYKDAKELLEKLRKAIEYNEDGSPISYRTWMLPDSEEEELEVLQGTGFNDQTSNKSSSITLRKLLDETKDYIDSPDFQQVVSCCLKEVFTIFDNNAFVKSLFSDTDALQVPEKEKSLTLAKLLPIISRQSHLVIAGNEYLNAFAYIKELQAFSAMIYTQFDEEMSVRNK